MAAAVGDHRAPAAYLLRLFFPRLQTSSTAILGVEDLGRQPPATPAHLPTLMQQNVIH
jgi:hypothetical protein